MTTNPRTEIETLIARVLAGHSLRDGSSFDGYLITCDCDDNTAYTRGTHAAHVAAAVMAILAAHPVQDEGDARVVNVYPIPEQTPAQVAGHILATREWWLQ